MTRGVRRRLGLVALGGFLVACRGESAPPAPDGDDTLEALTARLLETARDPDGAAALHDIAERRIPLWEAAVVAEPRRALDNVIPTDVAAALPDDVKPLVEAAFDRTAPVTSTVADDFERGVATYELSFDVGSDERVRLFPAFGRLRPPHGTRLHARGYAHGGVALVESARVDDYARVAGSQWRDQRVLAVLVGYPTSPNTDTQATVRANYFDNADSTAAYYATVSNGAATLTGDVVGPFTVDFLPTCSQQDIWKHMFGALAANNIDVAGYDNLVAIVPDLGGCGYNGVSTLGPSQGNTSVVVVAGPGSALLRHELGHSIGLLHAHSMSCPGGGLAADESTCTVSEYGSQVDPMGTGSGIFNSFGLEHLGFINHGTTGTIAPVTTSGTYTLTPLAGTVNAVRALKVPYQKDAVSGYARSFYVEYRTATGLDATLGAQHVNKVYITLATDEDMYDGYQIAVLSAGQSFTAPDGTGITYTSGTAASASIAVAIPAQQGACQRNQPLALSPDGSSAENTFTAGSTAIFNGVIRNNDSTACGPSTFNLSIANLPAGWTYEVPPGVAVAAGGLMEITMRITSPASATGTTAFNLVIANPVVGATHDKTSFSGAYTVSSCAPVVPTFTLQPATGMTVASGGGAGYLFEFKNNNPSTCGSTHIWRVDRANSQNGWGLSNENATYDVAPGETLAVPVTITAPGSTTSGTHTVGANVLYSVHYNSGAVSYAWASAHATATIGTACVYTPPLVTVSPARQTSTSGAQLDYTVTVRNVDGANCAAQQPSMFTLAVTPPANFNASLDTSSFSLAIGASATTTLHVTPIGAPAVGDHVASVTASHNGQTNTAAATYRATCGTIVAPTVSISPGNQSGNPGDTLVYSVTVTNPNTSTLCGSRTYSLVGTVTNLNGTSGWTTQIGTPSMTLASQASAVTTFSVTSPTNIENEFGAYRPTVTVTDDVGNVTTRQALYAILCQQGTPGLTLSPAATSAAPGADVPFIATVTNNDTVVCADATADFAQTLPGGITATVPASVVIAPGASAQVTWTPHLNAGMGEGSYTPRLTVVDGLSTSATAYIDVPCTSRVAPSVDINEQTTDTAIAGTELLYDVDITNNDAGMCANQTFALSFSAPAGWTASLEDASFTMRGNNTRTTVLHVTSPLGTPGGANPISVTAVGDLSGSGTGNDVYNVQAVCVTAPPTVSLSPASQSGSPGTQRMYTATITNNDTACNARNFTLTRSVPAGWSSSLSPGSVTGLASGASATVTLNVTPSSSAFGSHQVSVTATNNPSGSGTGSATYDVTCTRTNPTVSLAPTTGSGNAGATVNFTATITNRDTGCASQMFTLSHSAPAGWSGTLTPSSVTLASGASTTSTFASTSSAGASGSNTVSVTATGTDSGMGSGTATHNITVPCTRAAPTVSLSPTSQSGTASTPLAYTVSVTNNDSAGCAQGTFSLSRTLPSMPPNWLGSFSPSNLTLAAGATSTSTLTVTSPMMAMPNTFMFTVTASNAASGSASAMGTYVVTSVPPPIDAGIDAPTDAGTDAGIDAPTDAGPVDAPTDAGPVDAAPDAETDAGPDGGTNDATPDAADDAAPGPDAPFGPDAGDSEPPPGGCCSAGDDQRGSTLLAAFVLAALLSRRRRKRAA